MRRLRFAAPGFRARLAGFCQASDPPAELTAAVARILADVRERGDRAVVEWTAKIDGARLTPGELRLPPGDLAAAARSLAPGERRAIREAIRCVRDFHRRTLPRSWRGKNPHGAVVGEDFHPLERVGIWVPGGSAPLVSTVVMTTALARLARVPGIAVCTPPGPDGSVNRGLLAALHLCGVDEVYRAGGVMAVGAMAFGTDTVAPVCKVFGPGNAYVMEAKRQVFGTVGVDLLPGPSEVMVIADSTADPRWVAADLLAQAEHGSGREKVYLVTTEEGLPNAVEAEMRRQLSGLRHAEAIRAVLRGGFLAVVVGSLDEAVEVADIVAPEHLELHLENRALGPTAKRVRNAGAILVGAETPTVLGDFTAGPSHTLPTGRAARFCSGLTVRDFFRRTSIVRYGRSSLARARPVVAAFATLEHLDAHGRSLEMRCGGGGADPAP